MPHSLVERRNPKGELVYRIAGFDKGSSTLKSQQIFALTPVLHRIRTLAFANGLNITVYITGLHDVKGKQGSNAYLAGLRALAVKNYMAAHLHEFPPHKLVALGSSVHTDMSPHVVPSPKPTEEGFYDRAVDIIIKQH